MFKRLKINFSLKGAVYPVIMTLIIVVIVLFFLMAAGFLAQNINTAFGGTINSTEGNSTKVDLQDFYLIAKKLGI